MEDLADVLKISMEGRLSQRQSVELVQLLEKDGRAILVVGDFKDCATVRDSLDVQSRRRMAAELPLKTVILPSYIVAHQNFSVRLLDWLLRLFTKCSGFRALFAEVFFCVSVSIR